MKQSDQRGSPGNSLAERASKQAENLQRSAWLRRKGVDPNGQHQLDLLFPEQLQRTDLRHIPNDYARSSLFTARNKRTPRENLLHKTLFHYSQSVQILYTGPELRAEDDEVIWLQILNYGKNVPFGEPFDFSVKDLVKDVSWSKNGRYYDKARECISRLKANEVLALSTKAYGRSGSISLIQNYTAINDVEGKPTQYRVWLDPGLVCLFAGNTFTSHIWEIYRDLSPVGRRLADHIASHQQPFPLTLVTFQGMCGSTDLKMFSWRQTVKRACTELMNAGLAKSIILKDDFISVVR
ncbi:plasmid replication initiator TrfA [Delftia sp. GW456-R20]|uniref:plasmid replication initiator TrfA n=1 Tax=Delftia sp. GW456-R20 TaxID=1827145 RepID=UPI0009ED2B9C|nr:plasmid replication initiator TrfA [Delftia sp. GW456-R20]